MYLRKNEGALPQRNAPSNYLTTLSDSTATSSEQALAIGSADEFERALRRLSEERQRDCFAMGTHHARWLAGEFSRTGNWRVVDVLLHHTIAMRERLLETRRRVDEQIDRV